MGILEKHSEGRPQNVEAQDYIAAMSLHASSVCVISTERGGEWFGLTATAVTAVCAAPPRLLVCVNRSSSSHDHIVASGRFCVNVLRQEQSDIARLFAGMQGKRAERFDPAVWVRLPSGSPALRDAVASFDCRIESTVPHQTHSVIFGDVVDLRASAGESPLLYVSRAFRSLGEALL